MYWCSIFILPHKILKDVESKLRSFLWNGAVMRQTGANQKLKGFLDLSPLNCGIKLQWAISLTADSLWVKWIHSFVIKHKNLWPWMYLRIPLVQ